MAKEENVQLKWDENGNIVPKEKEVQLKWDENGNIIETKVK